MGKKSSPKAPKAPDPVATANAQAAANTKAAVDQSALNRINQYGPDGSITYSIDGYDANGVPKYSQHTQLSPEQQKLYDQQNAIATSLGGVAQQGIGRVGETMGKSFNYDNITPMRTGVQGGQIQAGLDYSGAPKMPGTEDFNVAAQKAGDSAYRAIAARLDPAFAQRESDQEAKLAAQGITNNSQAYRREYDNLSRDRNDAYGMAALTSYQAGLDAQNQGFQQGMASRQQGVSEVNTQGAFANEAQNQGFQQNMQGATFQNEARAQKIAEENYLRNLPLQDIAQLMGVAGEANTPEFADYSQAGIAAPDYQGAVYKNYDAANQQYQAKQQARSSMIGSIFGALGTGAGLAIGASDRRVKENIKRVGTLANGLATYVFNYIGNKAVQFGVMAQEALGVVPEAVGVAPNGLMYVDYKKVYAA